MNAVDAKVVDQWIAFYLAENDDTESEMKPAEQWAGGIKGL